MVFENDREVRCMLLYIADFRVGVHRFVRNLGHLAGSDILPFAHP